MTTRTLPSTILVVVTLLCTHASGASITTLYDPTSSAGGNMFDVTTFATPVQITSLDIHTQDTVANRTLRIYTRPERL